MFKKAVAAALISAMLASPLSVLADEAAGTTENSSQSQPAPAVQQTKAPEHKKALKKVLQKHKEALKNYEKVIQNREKALNHYKEAVEKHKKESKNYEKVLKNRERALNNYKKAVEKHKEALKKHEGTENKNE